MSIDTAALPAAPALVCVREGEGEAKLALWRSGALRDLTAAPDGRLHALDRLLELTRDEILAALANPALENVPRLDPAQLTVLAPAESQEVWAAGVTYLRSRVARMEETAAAKSAYELVYEADRPELFFKCAGWRVVPSGGEIGIRSDSDWDVPEPELAVLSNSAGEVIAYACGNDMSSRSIEGLNPLYLPQAKVYDAACSIGPAAVLAPYVAVSELQISLSIRRDGVEVFAGSARAGDMVRDPAELVGVLHSAYSLPAGAWLLTGTSIVPEPSYTAQPGDSIAIRIGGVGELENRVTVIRHSGATALPRLEGVAGRRDWKQR